MTTLKQGKPRMPEEDLEQRKMLAARASHKKREEQQCRTTIKNGMTSQLSTSNALTISSGRTKSVQASRCPIVTRGSGLEPKYFHKIQAAESAAGRQITHAMRLNHWQT